MLYLLAIAGWVVWMKMPPKVQPPIAAISLADGTELRLIHFAVGPSFRIHRGDTFGNRIRPDNARSNSFSTTDSHGGVWMLFTKFYPPTKTSMAPKIDRFEIVEPGSPYTLLPSRIEPANGPYSFVLFPAIPSGSKELHVRFVCDGIAGQATIPNPVNGWIQPPAEGASANVVRANGLVSLPHQLESAGFKVTAEKILFREANPGTGITGSHTADVAIEVTHPTAVRDDFSKTYEWFDEHGSRVRRGVLPWSDAVWGLRVNILELPSFPLPPERVIPVASCKAPMPGQVTLLPVPPRMQKEGVTDILVIGAGTYTISGKKLMVTPASAAQSVNTGNGKTLSRTVKAGPAPQTVATLNGMIGASSITESTWAIYMFSTYKQKASDPERRMMLRVRRGDAICTPGSSGQAIWGAFRRDSFGSYAVRKIGPVVAGEEITVEAFKPEKHTFEFSIPRPEFVVTPLK
jgi:hypothetical protein